MAYDLMDQGLRLDGPRSTLCWAKAYVLMSNAYALMDQGLGFDEPMRKFLKGPGLRLMGSCVCFDGPSPTV